MSHNIITSCRFCNSTNLTKYIDLGNIPLVNNLLDSPNEKCYSYPLRVYFCNNCYMSQLNCAVDPKILFEKYCYRSGMSQKFKDHCYNLAEDICSILQKDYLISNNCKQVVMDIASNDGSLLKEIKKYYEERPSNYNLDLIGIEPATNLCNTYYKGSNIKVINKFFNKETARDIIKNKECGMIKDYPTVITAQNVFAHVDNIKDFMDGIDELLLGGATFIVEAPWAGDLITKSAWDSVYHEHYSYLSITGMCNFVKQFDLEVAKIKYFDDIHGGTIRYYIRRCGYANINDKFEITNALYREKILFDNLSKVQQRIENIKENLLDYLNNKVIVGIGQAAKATVTCNFCGLNTNNVEYIADTTPEKQGKYQPGTKIPIVPFNKLENESREMLIFPWNWKNEIINKVEFINPNSKFIIAVPNLEIIKND